MAKADDKVAVAVGDEIATIFNMNRGEQPRSVSRDQGKGPFARLVLRGATVIDGTGAPPQGPFDIAVEGGRITEMRLVGSPHVPINPSRRLAPGDHEIDCHGKYATPGFIDSHAHIGSPFVSDVGEIPPADYVYKLWLAHGVTTIREMACFNGLSWTLDQKQRAQRGEIVAPQIQTHAYLPVVNDWIKTLHTPTQVREWLVKVKERGADGVKFFGAPPQLMREALAACRDLSLRTGCHHAQTSVARMNALTTAEWGLTSAEHFYGLQEALYDSRTVQNYPVGYEFGDEYLRFSTAGQGFAQAAAPGSAKWRETMDRFLELGFTFVPTFNVYDANRDLMRARRADWNDEYMWKGYRDLFTPYRGGHGSYFYRWSTTNELEWKQNYRVWMQFLYEYKNRGGRVCAGSDSGFIYSLFGFGFVRELEMLQEAGFNALEVIKAATIDGAALLGLDEDRGSIEVGKRADLLVHDFNPLSDFKLLYGTGAMRLNEATQKIEWQRGLRYTIVGGICYDVVQLLADVRKMVTSSYNTESAVHAV
ncbi:MAG: amidohydrolase family protein [Propionivibrio sp.]|nr:amidohydrolase family protein [Propionivibrio sp.]